MITESLSLLALAFAAVPTVLFLFNLRVYRRLPRLPTGDRPNRKDSAAPRVSVLIPARNEEAQIAATLQAVLSDPSRDFELLVLNDHSADNTAGIVQSFARQDSRVRLIAAPELPPGWCGKQHACHVLARHARAEWLVFMDADVHLAPGALERITHFSSQSGIDLASGVPRQLLGSFSERLLIPLIHWVLLCFLPMHWARRSRSPAFAAGCGQLMVARASAYRRCGGHAAIRTSLHDGLTLPRTFRRAGFRTGLFDATDIAECRMYRTGRDVWPGLAKNATEGLAAPGTLLPMTLILFVGQVLPWLLLASGALSSSAALAAGCAVALSLIPRLVSSRRFGQPPSVALLHPAGVAALLAIQWFAFFNSQLGRPSSWKGRDYFSPSQAAAS